MTRIYLALLLLIPYGIQAQEYNFINYSIKHKLAATQTSSICQDEQGYLWIGTLAGVNRFDGITFKNFSVEDGLTSNRTDVVFADSKGQIWSGSKGGICRFSSDTIEQFLLPPPLSNEFVITIAEAPNGDLWVGTADAGAARFDGKGFEVFGMENGLIQDGVRSILAEEDGTIWFGVVGGISTYKDGKMTTNAIPELTEFNIASIIRDQKGALWIGTANSGIYKYLDGELEHFGMAEGLASHRIECLFEDSDGQIWIGRFRGLSKFDGSSFINFGVDQGLPAVIIKSIFQDNEGNIWLASNPAGIFKFGGETIVSYSTSTGLASKYAMSILEDNDGNICFSHYDEGITILQEDTTLYFTTDNGLLSNTVWSSLQAKDNALWFGTSLGVSVMKDGQLAPFDALNDQLPDTRITSIYEDNQGDIWLGHRRGASKWDGVILVNHFDSAGFGGSRVRDIVKFQGAYWFACENGVVRHKDDASQLFTVGDGLSNDNVMCIMPDHEGFLWIGTENGLNYYDGKQFTAHKLATHFSSNHINFLITDSKNRLWIGTNYGIFRLDLEQFYATGNTQFKLFTDLDGIRSLETNLNAAYRDHRDNIWMGTSEGVVKFDPRKEKEITAGIEPFINITEIQLFLEPTDWSQYTDSIRPNGLPNDPNLKYNKNYLTFYYSGISHTNPEKVLYQFYLEGFEETWKPITSAKFATYSNLPYGNYTFKVRASNKDGLWNSTPATYSFEIKAPFWVKWWFFLLCLGFLAGIAYLIYRSRMRNIAQKREKEQLINRSKMLSLEQQTLNSSMNRHFIFNALNSIQYYINRQDRLAANKYLSSFARLVRKNLDSSQTNVVSLAEELDRLELYLTLEHMRFSNKFSYEIIIDPAIDTESVLIPAMLLQPFVENSIWHGILPMEEGGKITLDIARKGDQLCFTIDDNGIGIETSLQRKGQHQDHISQGMAITSGRLRLLKEMTNETLYVKGPYELKNSDNEAAGTRVEIVLPVDYESVIADKIPEKLVEQ